MGESPQKRQACRSLADANLPSSEQNLLLASAEHLFLALTYGMDAVLLHEVGTKELTSLGKTFEARFDTFKLKIAPKHKIKNEVMQLVQSLKAMLTAHKKSPVEFSTKKAFVICSDDYNLSTLTGDRLKKQLQQAKEFIATVKTILDNGQ